jgi:hypothetical protein
MTTKTLEAMSEDQLRQLELDLRKVRKTKMAAKAFKNADVLKNPEVAVAKNELDDLDVRYKTFTSPLKFVDSALSFRIHLKLETIHSSLVAAWQEIPEGDPVNGNALFYFDCTVEPLSSPSVKPELLGMLKGVIEDALRDAPFDEVYSLIEPNEELDQFVASVVDCIDRLNFLCPDDTSLLRLMTTKTKKKKAKS